MSVPPLVSRDIVKLIPESLQGVLQVLRDRGFTVVGPTIRDSAIVLDDLHSIDDLPVGWSDTQDAGTYRLKKNGNPTFFGFTMGQQSWKKYFHLPEKRLWKAERERGNIQLADETHDNPKLALVGVRPCELSAIAIQDKVLRDSAYRDQSYALRREDIFVIAVNCGKAGGTCFCVSMNTGPKAATGFDLALTEILDRSHYFVVEIGSEAGKEILSSISTEKASTGELAAAEKVLSNTASQMGRSLDTNDIRELLYRNYDIARWDDVAKRCLTCGNCTLVCPTCFCTTVEDVADLAGKHAERWQKWDSCFTVDFSYIHGGSIRSSARARYRHWITHKLASWYDQFGNSGCVGCGRCITWCPAAIDITEEAAAIRNSEPARSAAGSKKEN